MGPVTEGGPYMDNISQVIHNCETCAAIKQAKRVKASVVRWTMVKVQYGDSPDFFRDVSNDLTLIVNLKAALRGIKLPAYATLIG
ncbi:hypothetical protein DUI87_03297 [Hirundo rustica rustica]|uniref:Uncharacterized protein n=1 Tax=Hirundo rustica rustica TaxID=333673 RepID=A0A3M0L335_HIRRU|nr:hypothetical protein DUI87_03297 [Hirundo rustica rustica]